MPLLDGLQTVTTRRRPALALAIGTCAIALTLSSGCIGGREYVQNGFKVGPNYRPPCVPADNQWIDTKDPHVLTAAPNRDTWWTVFGDPVLNELVARAYKQNPTIQVACWRIQEARASRGVAAGGLFPQQQAVVADYRRNAVSQTVQNQVHTFPFYDEPSIGAGLVWELDFWGKYRRSIEAADARLDASIESYNNALVVLLADVATNYVQVRTLDLRLKYTRQNLRAQQGSLEIARQRFRNGTTSELDVSQAVSHVEHTESLIPALEILRRQAANRLCILLGMPPRETADILQGTQPVPTAPPEVAVGIPADLLRQRPDVREVEREVAAQSARIGIATSELYPHLSIVGTIGFDSSQFAELFDTKSLAGNVGPSFRWDILNYGRLVNGIRMQDARFQELAFQYQAKVLKAYEEAENALVGFLKSQQRLKSLARSVKAGKRSVELATAQYREGLTDFNRVFTMERLLAEEQDQMADAQGETPLNLILLYKALGGGWQVSPDQAKAVPPLPFTSNDASPPVPPVEPK